MIGRQSFFWSQGGLVLALALIAGCSPEAPPVAETPPPPVTVSQPLTREVIDHDDYEGRIAAVETVEVRARVRGHVVKVNFHDGQMVKAGDMLYEIDPRPYQASLDAAQAQKASADASLDLPKENTIVLQCAAVRHQPRRGRHLDRQAGRGESRSARSQAPWIRPSSISISRRLQRPSAAR